MLTSRRSRKLGDEDELASSVAVLTDLVRLGGPVEGECLNLDHQLALFQQLSRLGEGLLRLAVGAASGHPRARLQPLRSWRWRRPERARW